MKIWEIEFQEDQVVKIGNNDMTVKAGDVLSLTAQDEKKEMPAGIPADWNKDAI